MKYLKDPWFWVKLLALLNLLDLTASLPTRYNSSIGSRSTPELVIQCIALLPTLAWLAQRAPTWGKTLWAVPIPTAPKIAVALFLAVEIGHIATQQEFYPFTDVGMYTFRFKGWTQMRLKSVYMTGPRSNPTPYSIRRAGDVLFRQETAYERQLALLYHKFRANEAVHERVAEACRAAGLEVPRPMDVTIRFNGRKAVLQNAVPVKLTPKAKRVRPLE